MKRLGLYRPIVRWVARWWRWCVVVALSAIVAIGLWHAGSLAIAAQQPIDAWFILGGSIKREMYIADQARPAPPVRSASSNSSNTNTPDRTPESVPASDIPILISTGSPLPCVWAIFNRAGVALDRVWIEECADSTFDNFVYSVPILAGWGAQHVKLTTSETHYPRARWMAQIAFGMRGIWVEFDPAPEVGVPANRESPRKTVLDVTRMAAFAIVAPIAPVGCDRLVHLSEADWSQWREPVRCEHQAQVRPEELPPELFPKLSPELLPESPQ